MWFHSALDGGLTADMNEQEMLDSNVTSDMNELTVKIGLNNVDIGQKAYLWCA